MYLFITKNELMVDTGWRLWGHKDLRPMQIVATRKVFRNVKDYGAKGDGKTDDTEAINKAVSDGNRCGQDCGSSSVTPAVVYFPSGTYLVSSPVIQYYMTQFIGNPHSRPVIKASSSFIGLGVITSDVYIPGASGAEWYINVNNFFRSVRNFVIDVTDGPNQDELAVPMAGIHWQVAQATSLENIAFRMSTKPGNNQYGIFMENGSGGMMANLDFRGGKLGAMFGNQQFTTRALSFRGCETAIQVLWDWAWTMKSVTISNCKVGFNITGGAGTKDTQGTGSLLLLDSNISDTPIGILTSLRMAEQQTTLYISNLGLTNVPVAIKEARGATLLQGGTTKIASWGFGRTYGSANSEGRFQSGGVLTPQAPLPEILADSDFGFTEMGRDGYTATDTMHFFNIKGNGGAKGDGVADDTQAINDALKNGADKIIFFPHGIYKITDTIFVPAGSRIVGSAWSQIMASGSAFQNIRKPKVAIRVGRKDEKGIVEIQDMLFTAQGPTAGLIMLEWNIAGDKESGYPKMWDCHVRIGGAIGTNLQSADCPKGAGTDKCIAASMLLHMSKSGNGYWENVWAWVADHDLDTKEQGQIDIYSARGILIQSQGPTWLYGTGSEHNVLYQYQFSDAKNIFMGMIQTESPYFQPAPVAPKPFMGSIATQNFPGDPKFVSCKDGAHNCAFSWALRIIRSSDIYIYGAGLYSWFDNYSQDCLKTESCQQKGVYINRSNSIWIYNLVTKATVEMVSPAGGKPTIAKTNQNGFCATILGWFGDALGSGGSAGGGGLGGGLSDASLHDSPPSATIIPIAGTKIAPGQTLTLTPALASEIANLPEYTFQNKPPGPAGCQGDCDFWRRITATCCGIGGTVVNPVVIPAGIDLPADIPLPKGFISTFPFTSTTGNKIEAGVPLSQPETMPKRTHVDRNITFVGGIILPPNDPAAVIQNKSPKDIKIKPLPCTTINGNGQFTMSSACLPGIRELPTSGPGTENNKPPGPKNCHNSCDLFRLLTGTCCGFGGTMWNGIKIPKIPLPKPLRLPKGLKPVPPITIGKNVYSTISVEIEIPEGTTVDIDLPGPIPLPTGSAPGSPPDPREPAKCNSAGDCCDPEVDTSFGLCPNGNYPLFNKGSVNCDFSVADALPRRSPCQRKIDDDIDKAKKEVEQAKQCSGTPPEPEAPNCAHHNRQKRKLNKRGLSTTLAKDWMCRDDFPNARDGCEATYVCPGDKAHFPNICANIRSAIEVRHMQSTFIRTIWRVSRKSNHDHRTSPLTRNRGQEKKKNAATSGWRIIGEKPGDKGCNVDEYPFSWTEVTPRVLRMTEYYENNEQGHHMDNWLTALTSKFRLNDEEHPDWEKRELNICIGWSDDTPGPGQDYGLHDDQTNLCAHPYGPKFILNAAPAENDKDLGIDPWFAANNVPENPTTQKPPVTWGPYYCGDLAPGLLQLVTTNGIKTLRPIKDWKTITQTIDPRSPQRVGYSNVGHLCETWPGETSPGNASLSEDASFAHLTPRQMGVGSFLDPRAYELVKECRDEMSDEDMDEALDPDTIDGSDDGTGAGGSGSESGGDDGDDSSDDVDGDRDDGPDGGNASDDGDGGWGFGNSGSSPQPPPTDGIPRPPIGSKIYIVGDSVFTYDRKRDGWTGNHKWISFVEPGSADPMNDDNVTFNWCAKSKDIPVSANIMPDTYTLAQWPTGDVDHITAFGSKTKLIISRKFFQANVGDDIGSIDWIASEDDTSTSFAFGAICYKYDKPAGWPTYYQCGSLDAGKKHMQFVYTYCVYTGH
ncbi:hypothetical protein ABW21_db0200764 [Orbilia brochopaga]|nr:hypothetical protein ABW21_db0200764 [Drechslerella brochopaga]